MALTIPVGFVVDDAIVMIENIVRYIEVGEPPFEAALKGAGQIGFTIVSITFSLIAVFIPLLFMAGIIGRLFREFAMTRDASRSSSRRCVSLTLTPMMCARFLRRERDGSHGRLYRPPSAASSSCSTSTTAASSGCCATSSATLVVTLALIGLTGYALRDHPQGLLPAAGHRASSSASRRGAAGRLLRRDGGARAARSPTSSCADPAVVRRASLHRRDRRQRQREHRAHVHPAQAVSERARRARRGHRAAAAEAGAQSTGVEGLHAGRCRTCTIGGRVEPDAVPVHADGRRLRASSTTGRRSSSTSCRRCPILHGRGVRPADRGAADVARRSTATPPRGSASRRSRSTTPSTTPSASAQVATIFTQTEPVPRHPRGEAEVPDRTRRARPASTSPTARRRRRCRSPRSPISSTRSTPLAINHQGQFPAVTLSFNLAPGAALEPGRRRASTRCRARARRAGERARPTSGHGAGLPGFARERAAAGPGRDHHRLHRPRRALRELHPPDHDPVDAAVGRRRRAARADGVPARTSASSRSSASFCSSASSKKNAIMMIDFALEAERERGHDARARPSTRRACCASGRS